MVYSGVLVTFSHNLKFYYDDKCRVRYHLSNMASIDMTRLGRFRTSNHATAEDGWNDRYASLSPGEGENTISSLKIFGS